MNGSGAIWQACFMLLALLISILASYTMFNFTGNLKRKDNAFRVFWLSGGAFVFGIGMWVKHFVIILSSDHERLFFTWSMLVSVLFTIFFSLMAFVMLTFHNVIRYRLVAGSLILSFGVAFMNYFSTLGEPISAIHIEPALVVLSMLLLFSGTLIALGLSEWSGERYKWLASLVLGFSVFIERLLGGKAMTIDYSYTYAYSEDRWTDDMNILAAIIGVGMLIILVSTLFTWYIDKRMNFMDERYKLLVENSLDTIAIFQKDKWVFLNEAGVRMFEAREPGDLIGASIYSFLRPEDHDKVRERMHNLIIMGNSGPLEQEWYTLKGKTLNTEIVELMTTIENEPAIQVIIRDISERKKNEELLINSEKLYVAGQLAAGIAHEIRNPLTSLKGFLHLLASGRKDTGTYYEIMTSELNRIESIVSEMLMLSKPQVYELSYPDVRNIMRETVTLLETQAILHSIMIETDFGPDPLWVYGVESQVKQVFINVIKNAIEAMTDGGAIRVRMRRVDDTVLIRIIDEGPGIGENQLSKMGQPFYTTKDKGTGLGLMVSYKIVDNHQGKIEVHSQLGAGTTFEIRLPFRYPDNSSVKISS